MKPTIKQLLAAIIVLLIGGAVLVFAILKSSDYNGAKGPIITQQSLRTKLAAQTPKVAKTPGKPAPVSPTRSPPPTSAPTAPSVTSQPVRLTNSGPGSTILLFGIIVTLGYLAACWRQSDGTIVARPR